MFGIAAQLSYTSDDYTICKNRLVCLIAYMLRNPLGLSIADRSCAVRMGWNAFGDDAVRVSSVDCGSRGRAEYEASLPIDMSCKLEQISCAYSNYQLLAQARRLVKRAFKCRLEAF